MVATKKVPKRVIKAEPADGYEPPIIDVARHLRTQYQAQIAEATKRYSKAQHDFMRAQHELNRLQQHLDKVEAFCKTYDKKEKE